MKKAPPKPKRKPEDNAVSRGNRTAKYEAEADAKLMETLKKEKAAAAKKKPGYKKGGKVKGKK